MPIAIIIATMDMPKNILIQILTVELGKIWLHKRIPQNSSELQL